MTHAPRITVYHATAPACSWSWGYEAAFNRLEMVYGDQIDVKLRVGCPYEDFAEWEKNYGMTFEEFRDWTKGEISERTRVPLWVPTRREDMPKTVMPASLAVLAAERIAPTKAARFRRAMLRRFAVEGQDITQKEVLEPAAAEAGIDPQAIFAAFETEETLIEAYDHQGHDWPHVPVGFYNVAISDGGDRVVLIDFGFEPSVIEGAIDWLSGGKLRKKTPTDIGAYLSRHGPTPATEIERVFALPPKEAEVRLSELEKTGKARRIALAGASHWTNP